MCRTGIVPAGAAGTLAAGTPDSALRLRPGPLRGLFDRVGQERLLDGGVLDEEPHRPQLAGRLDDVQDPALIGGCPVELGAVLCRHLPGGEDATVGVPSLDGGGEGQLVGVGSDGCTSTAARWTG
jgi:hypothetical protein